MDGDAVNDWCIPSLLHKPCTMVLVGKTGNGKSATGNSILGRTAFNSRKSPKGVTSTADCQSATSINGQVANVIDTPGLFEFGVGAEVICQEIMKCVELARDGIHAVLLVFSVRGRFTEEEEAVVRSLQNFFGPKITDYMIIIFTCGDDFEEDGSIEDFLADSQPLQNLVEICKKRYLLFDNKTKDAKKKASQLHNLLALVDTVIVANGGHAYTDSLFAEFKKATTPKQKVEEDSNEDKTHSIGQIQNSFVEHLLGLIQRLESRMNETNRRLQQQLDDEKDARLNADEKIARDARKQYEDEIRKLNETNKKLQEQLDELKENLATAKRKSKRAEEESEDEIRKLKRALAEIRSDVYRLWHK